MTTATATSATRYPLSWPAGWRRTEGRFRQRSRFETRGAEITVWAALQRLQAEVDRLGGRDALLSTNLRTRLDGLPYSDQATPADPGAALYFTLRGQPRCLACDRWTTVAGNIAAIAAHIDALRRIDRYGVGTLDQAFAGYTALPSHAATDWRLELGVAADAWPASLEDIDARFRARARTAHPDAGGSHDAMARLNAAREAARTAWLAR